MSKTEKPKGRKLIEGIVGLIILIVIIVSVSNSNKTTVTTTATKSGTTTTKTTAKSTAKVGDTINIGGSKGLAVNLAQIIDPATGSSQYTTADAGKRFVGAKVQITNNGTASFQGDANNDVTLIGSDNQSYTADFNDIAGCTNFSSGSYMLAAGASATGCVVFQVPNGVTVAKVQFAPNGGFSGDTGEWATQ